MAVRAFPPDAVLSTGRLLSVAILPVNDFPLLVGEADSLALFPGQLRPRHVRSREIARLEPGAAKVGISQARPHEGNSPENRSTQVTHRKVSVREVDLDEVVPAKGGLGQVSVHEGDRADLRSAKEGAREGQ